MEGLEEQLKRFLAAYEKPWPQDAVAVESALTEIVQEHFDDGFKTGSQQVKDAVAALMAL